MKQDGVALLHSIGYALGSNFTNSWLQKYIFPGGYCPALSETVQVIESSQLLVTDIEILYLHYAETLRHWRVRFMKNRDKAQKLMGERFCRMWEFYLAGCEVAFRFKDFMVFQIQMIKSIEAAPLTRDYIGEWEMQNNRQLDQRSARKKIS